MGETGSGLFYFLEIRFFSLGDRKFSTGEVVELEIGPQRQILQKSSGAIGVSPRCSIFPCFDLVSTHVSKSYSDLERIHHV